MNTQVIITSLPETERRDIPAATANLEAVTPRLSAIRKPSVQIPELATSAVVVPLAQAVTPRQAQNLAPISTREHSHHHTSTKDTNLQPSTRRNSFTSPNRPHIPDIEPLSPRHKKSPQPRLEPEPSESDEEVETNATAKMNTFKYIRTLGNGTYGTVSLVNTPNGEKCVIKAISKDIYTDPRDKEKLRRAVANEIRAGSVLNHKGIVQLTETFEDDEHWFLVMEYIKGKNLYEFVKQLLLAGSLILNESLVHSIFSQLLASVAHCHEKGVYHLDLKLENVMITENNVIKLIDFGLCELIDPKYKKRDKLISRWVGSPDYKCPEIIMEKPYAPQKADVWSLGVILYVLFFGEFPFNRQLRIQSLKSSGIHPNLRWPSHRKIPRDVEDLIEQMLEPDGSKRIAVEDILKHEWVKKKFRSNMSSGSL
mmetsp:Transcript_29905/g.42034  ORF Transcript_29905/g.42034 Transcript_29905/m.42034 type:complete len:425 (-) Transcript_29905:59-1333(-)